MMMANCGALTQKKHLDLVALHHLIPLQLILDLLVAGLALLLLRAHSATHLVERGQALAGYVFTAYFNQGNGGGGRSREAVVSCYRVRTVSSRKKGGK